MPGPKEATLSTSNSSDRTASPRRRLQRMARWMRALIAIAAASLVVATSSAWFRGDNPIDPHVRDFLRSAGVAVDAAQPASTTVALMAFGLPNTLLALFGLFQAWRLFGAYGRGHVFGAVAVRHIRAIAWTLIATTLWRTLSGTLIVLLTTWHNPPGQRQLWIGISWDDYLGALFGGLLIAMAWAMAEAGRIEQDNAGFV